MVKNVFYVIKKDLPLLEKVIDSISYFDPTNNACVRWVKVDWIVSVLIAEKSNVDTLPGAQQFVHKVPVQVSLCFWPNSMKYSCLSNRQTLISHQAVIASAQCIIRTLWNFMDFYILVTIMGVPCMS